MQAHRYVWAIPVLVLLSVVLHWTSSASGSMQKARRVVPVTNVVPKGAAPFNGDIVKVEVIEAVDIVPAKGPKKLKVAVQIRNSRGDRVRCSLKMMFDGKMMGQADSVDLPKDQSDLTIFSCYCGDGKRADHLDKLTAEASDIKIGD